MILMLIFILAGNYPKLTPYVMPPEGKTSSKVVIVALLISTRPASKQALFFLS